MKTMTKIIAGAFTAAAIFIGTNVNAQTTPANKLRLGIGVEAGVPTGGLNDYSKFELGGTARLQYGVSDNLALTLTSGYYNFFKSDNAASTATQIRSLGMIPVKAGLKVFAGKNFYVAGEAGAGFEVHMATEGENKNTKLILSPGIGYANSNWDIGVRYENFSGSSGQFDKNFGLVGVRLAYGFPL